MPRPAGRIRFDFRAAIEERERAIRALESMLRSSSFSGEEPDIEIVAELQAVITGRQPAVRIDLTDGARQRSRDRE